MSTRTRVLEELHMTVAKARKVGWLTESAADIISEELRKELLRAMREEGDVKLRGKTVTA